jgi:hypothetical protein
MSQKQREETAKELPDRVDALLDGMYAELKRIFRTSGTAHNDIGLTSVTLMLDQSTDNMWSDDLGYNWFGTPQSYTSNTPNTLLANYTYRNFYAYVKAANDVLNYTSETSTDSLVLATRAQARAFRAWAYLNLVQIYQLPYQGHEDDPAVPLVNEKTTTEQCYNNPRRSVAEVYDYIVSELEAAKEVLAKGDASVLHTDIDEFVVRGFLARAYLIMGKNTEAAEEARYVIDNSGRFPYSLEEASYPNFYNVKDHNVLWGMGVTPIDRCATTGILNWQSFMTFLGSNSTYAQYVPRNINPALYHSMGKKDVRRAWWMTITKNAEKKWVVNLLGLVNMFVHNGYTPEGAQDAALDFVNTRRLVGRKYAGIKFGPENGDINSEDNSADFPIMRIEEMYYIEAEAKQDKALLEDFVKTYREPGYTVDAYQPASLTDEIYRQRRIEFWGEGLSYFDMLRLKKGMVRSDTKAIEDALKLSFYPVKSRFDIAPESPAFIMVFPRREVLQNKGLVQNPLPSETDYKIPFE